MATMERDLQKLSQSPLLLLTLMLTLMLGTATMATTERGLQMPSLSPLLPLSQKLMLMLGTDTMATVTVAMDGAYYRPYGYGYYGKRSADAEPEPTAAADPN